MPFELVYRNLTRYTTAVRREDRDFPRRLGLECHVLQHHVTIGRLHSRSVVVFAGAPLEPEFHHELALLIMFFHYVT